MTRLGSQLVALYFIVRYLRDELKNLVFYDKVLTRHIKYTERVYRRDGILASEWRENFDRLLTSLSRI